MGVVKTPGVYMVEKDAFPNAVVEVATAVPAFVGHTERADSHGMPLTLRPMPLSSMAEYHQCFGGPPKPLFNLSEAAEPQDAQFQALSEPGKPSSKKGYKLTQVKGSVGGDYGLYSALRLFFQNGGGRCYVASVGSYQQELDPELFQKGIDALKNEKEPTLLLVPEAVRFSDADTCRDIQHAMLSHCGDKMRNRFAILDLWNGDKPRDFALGDPVAAFRDGLGTRFLDFASAYYPWLNTSVVGEDEVDYQNIHPGSLDLLGKLIRAELNLPDTVDAGTAGQVRAMYEAGLKIDFMPAVVAEARRDPLHRTLAGASQVYQTVLTEVRRQLNVMPPSSAMAGIYTMVDDTQGVWKAPANVVLNGVISPTVSISDEQQEDLIVSAQGKSINAIRAFSGQGVLVWGARTLDANSLDWRYISARRTTIMLEESCRLAANAVVFAPNTAETWFTVESMITNFLTNVWKRGGLMGAVPKDAFSVHVGPGETMTPDDVPADILRVTVLVALVRPAEFIEITFEQAMASSG